MTNVRHITSASVHRVATSDNQHEDPLTSIQYENLPRKIEQSADCPNCIEVVKVQRKRTRLLCDQCGMNGSWRSSRTNSLPQKDTKKERVENFVGNISDSKDLDLLLATISKKCNVVITMYTPKAEGENYTTFEQDVQKQEVNDINFLVLSSPGQSFLISKFRNVVMDLTMPCEVFFKDYIKCNRKFLTGKVWRRTILVPKLLQRSNKVLENYENSCCKFSISRINLGN